MARPTSNNAWYLGIDLGTGGVKVAAVGRDGIVRASAFASIDTDYADVLTGSGGATQDASKWWLSIVQCIRTILGSLVAADCAGVGITGQWGSSVPVDARGVPVGPCLLWSDDRGGAWSAAITGGPLRVSGYAPAKLLTWMRRTGGAPSPGGADPTGHEQFLRNRAPGVHAAAFALLEPVDYIGARLTGCVAATPASMTLSWLTDNRSSSASYDPKLVELANRDRSKLPALRTTGSVLGPLDPKVADELGLGRNVEVVCGVPDLHTAGLGAGLTDDFDGHVAISTTAWVSATVPFKRTDVLHQIASVPGLRAGSYLIANNHETGGACLRWFRESMYGSQLHTDDLPTYDFITKEAASAPTGSGGVIFCPWLKGERSPVEDRHLRASFLNVSLATDRAALARSVLEGVAYNARWLLDATERFARKPLSSLRLLGGGAQSALWCQIHADVIGRPIEQVVDPVNVNVRGAAWFAALSLGHLGIGDVRSCRPVGTVFTPDPVSMRAYQPLMREFAAVYKQQRGMYRRLNNK